MKSQTNLFPKQNNNNNTKLLWLRSRGILFVDDNESPEEQSTNLFSFTNTVPSQETTIMDGRKSHTPF